MEYGTSFRFYSSVFVIRDEFEGLDFDLITYFNSECGSGVPGYPMYILYYYVYRYINGEIEIDKTGSIHQFIAIPINKESSIPSLRFTNNKLAILKPQNDVEYLAVRDEYLYWEKALIKTPGNEKIKNINDFFKTVISEFEAWYNDYGLDIPSIASESEDANDNISDSERGKDNIIRIQNEKIIILKRKARNSSHPPKEDFVDLASKHRFKNGKINYSQIAKQLGVNNKTAKSWCDFYKIE